MQRQNANQQNFQIHSMNGLQLSAFTSFICPQARIDQCVKAVECWGERHLEIPVPVDRTSDASFV